MLLCWDTEAEKRPRFVELVDFFLSLLNVCDLCHPFNVQKIICLARRCSEWAFTPGSISLVEGSFERDTFHHKNSGQRPFGRGRFGQSTVEQHFPSDRQHNGHGRHFLHFIWFYANDGCKPIFSVLSKNFILGDGICRNVFPPYQAKISTTLMKLEPSRQDGNAQSVFADNDSPQRSMSKSSGGGNSDDSTTLHGSASTQIRYQVRPSKGLVCQPAMDNEFFNPTVMMSNEVIFWFLIHFIKSMFLWSLCFMSTSYIESN